MSLTIILTVTDCCGRLLNCIGLKQYGFEELYTEEKVQEGKTVIENYRKDQTLIRKHDPNNYATSV